MSNNRSNFDIKTCYLVIFPLQSLMLLGQSSSVVDNKFYSLGRIPSVGRSVDRIKLYKQINEFERLPVRKNGKWVESTTSQGSFEVLDIEQISNFRNKKYTTLDLIDKVAVSKFFNAGFANQITSRVVIYDSLPARLPRIKRNAENKFYWPTDSFNKKIGSGRYQGPAVHYRGVVKTDDNRICDINFILDAKTGDMLEYWDSAKSAFFDVPQLANNSKSQYNGIVSIGTVFNSTRNSFELRDQVRTNGSWIFSEINGGQEVDLPFNNPGLQTVYAKKANFTNQQYLPYQNPINEWGDGFAFKYSDFPGDLEPDYNSPNGQTAGVDAHFCLQSAWDFYSDVFGQFGFDGSGTAVGNIVNTPNRFDFLGRWWISEGPRWVPSWNAVVFGVQSKATLEVSGHEWVHADTDNLGIPDWFSEASSDFIGITMKAYTNRPTGSQVGTIPDIPNFSDWEFGKTIQMDGFSTRYLYKPSIDGASYDAWFDGILFDDPHFIQGPFNRFFYFLSQGSSANSSDINFSEYLPKGMSGIGADATAKLWHSIRRVPGNAESPLKLRQWFLSTFELLNAESPEAFPDSVRDSIENAFAAVNVGPPAGVDSIPMLEFERVEGLNPFLIYPNAYVIPSGIPVAPRKLKVTGGNPSDIVWGLGGLSVQFQKGGKFLEDGSFIAPNFPAFWPISATLRTDKRRFAVDLVYATSFDCDGDTAVDACDMGAIALSWFTTPLPYPGASLLGSDFVSDVDCQLFLAGFFNAFVKSGE